MMRQKKLLLLVMACFCGISSGWSQSAKPAFVGLQNQLSLQSHTFKISLAPHAGLQLGRHQLAAGPVIQLRDYSGIDTGLPQLNGLSFAYRYLLSKQEHKTVKWFLEYQSKAQLLKESWSSNHWDASQEHYVDVEQSSKELLWGNFVGVGSQWQLYPSLWLQSSIGAGYVISELSKSGNSPAGEDNSFDYRAYDNLHLGYHFSLGLYYRFGPGKKQHK